MTQAPTPAEVLAGIDEVQKSTASSGKVVWTPELVQFLSTNTFLFLCFTLALAALLLWRAKASGITVLRVFGILSIIGLSALLLFVGYSNSQLTPIVGLFGAIAGYLLGKESPPANQPDSTSQS